jgi:hypothetical protein
MYENRCKMYESQYVDYQHFAKSKNPVSAISALEIASPVYLNIPTLEVGYF